MFRAYKLPEVNFQFGKGTGADKFRGLQSLGPFKPLHQTAIKLAFVFPSNYRDDANRLYLGLKNGVGYFRGMEKAFSVSFNRENVEGITGFTISDSLDNKSAAETYVDAIQRWWSQRDGKQLPDLFLVLHPKTPDWDTETPYYSCKSLLLEKGLLSQDITVELIRSSNQFEWSVANIALGIFAKLGGVPWVISGEGPDTSLIIGVGRSDLFDPQERKASHTIGFTTCFSARGEFKFMVIGKVANTREDYLRLLGDIVEKSLQKAQEQGTLVDSLTLHVPKEFSRDENNKVADAARKHASAKALRISVIKITDEDSFFFLDNDSPDGIPPRGSVIQTSDRDYVLYVEGREETQVWRNRLPSALRVTPLSDNIATGPIEAAISHINYLSQVNWRGFNARCQPISIFYGSMVAKILSHLSPAKVKNLNSTEAQTLLETRLWFL